MLLHLLFKNSPSQILLVVGSRDTNLGFLVSAGALVSLCTETYLLLTGKLEVSGWHTFPNARRRKGERKKSEPLRLMFLVPGKQKPVTMYFVAVKQRFFKCHSRTVNLLKLS